MPATFLINVDSDSYCKDLERFLDEFLRIEGVIAAENNSNHSQRNIWIYKPDELNRGQGISLFNSISTLFCKVVKLGRVDDTLAAFEKVAPKLVEKYNKWRDRESKQLIKDITTNLTATDQENNPRNPPNNHINNTISYNHSKSIYTIPSNNRQRI